MKQIKQILRDLSNLFFFFFTIIILFGCLSYHPLGSVNSSNIPPTNMLDKLSCLRPIPITIIGGPIGKWVIWWPNWKSASAWSLWTQRVLLIVMACWANSYNHWQTAESASFSPAELEEEERWGKGCRKTLSGSNRLDILQLYHYSTAFGRQCRNTI